MGIQYFYNFCITDIDDIDLDSDILSAVRKSYFASFEKIRDKITYDSEGSSMLYDYCIERDKPMRWTVKDTKGVVAQEVVPAEDGRYHLCFYRDGKLIKRLLFSKLHTLLKAEYTDDNGAVYRSIEPRKVQGGLCLLYTDRSLADPVVLSAMPDVSDYRILRRLNEDFTDFTASASTNEGIVWFMSDAQTALFRAFVERAESELLNEKEQSFIGDEAPLYEKINAKDFNIKRNLSASLDISQAKDFSEPEDEEVKPDSADDEIRAEDNEAPEDSLTEEHIADGEAAIEEDNSSAQKPDKLIMADGAVYSYYGELDENGDRSGYGRTLTDLGRTAYEGTYRGDKRSGKGAYFYKDGTLCYSGDWSENVRHGIGVGISSRDGSMHIGKWVNNKPEGNGVRLTSEGNIKFVCKELADGGTVLMNYTDNDSVIISRYDKNGSKLSEKTISLTEI